MSTAAHDPAHGRPAAAAGATPASAASSTLASTTKSTHASASNGVLTPAALPSTWRLPLELAFLGAVWGASFMFMRVAAPDFGAIPLVELRLAAGALVLLPFLWVERARFPTHLWWKIVAIGAINSAIPFSLFAWAALRAPAGVGAITNSLAVMFTALVAFLFFGERIGKLRAVALLAGFVGVVVLASAKTAGASVGAAAAAGTLAAFLYGVAANVIRRQLGTLPPIALAAATLVCASLLLLPFAIAQWPVAPVPAKSWFSAAMLGVLCTGVAYAVYFRLLQRVGAQRASTVTYLVPLFGVGWAWLLLGEPLTLQMSIAAALILGSVALSQRGANAAAARAAEKKRT